jgi:hypothetical protein
MWTRFVATATAKTRKSTPAVPFLGMLMLGQPLQVKTRALKLRY